MAKIRIDCSDAFFAAMAGWLNDARFSVCSEALDYRCISGKVVTKSYAAEIDVTFIPSQLKRRPPIVFCGEPWIIRDLDWHCFRAEGRGGVWSQRDRLCWIHPAEWEMAHDYSLKPLSLVIEEGAAWLKNNVTKLLDRHWMGHQLGMRKWRTEWGGWGHGSIGTQELLTELKSNGHPLNWQRI
jgi:hypothetical protein